MRNRVVPLVGLLIGLLFVWGAVGEWMGVAQALGAPRVAGTVSDVQCNGYHSACSGRFTAADGSIRDRLVEVSGGSGGATAQAVFVPRIANGLVDSIQSRDTAYVGGVTLDVLPDVLIGIVLSVLGLLLTLPFLLIGILFLLRRRTG